MHSTQLEQTQIEFEDTWLKDVWDSVRSRIARPFRKEKQALYDPQTFALDACAPGRYVLKLGDGFRNVGRELKRKLCRVTEVALAPAPAPCLPENVSWFDKILLLGVLERLPAPATFMEELRRRMARRGSEVVITTPNAVSFATRLMLALARIGQERRMIYATRRNGVFTFRTLRALLDQAGYELVEARGVPVPFQSAVGDGRWTRALLKLNQFLLRLSRHLFADQICVRARPVAASPQPAIAEHTEEPAAYPQMLGRVA